MLANSNAVNFLCMNTLDSVLNLLPTPDLIDTLGHLLGQREDNVGLMYIFNHEVLTNFRSVSKCFSHLKPGLTRSYQISQT